MGRSEVVTLNLEEAERYRNQLYSCFSVDGKSAVLFPEEEIPEEIKELLKLFLNKLNKNTIYEHQGLLLKNLWNNKNTFLCCNEGSGRSFISIIYSLLTIILKHKTILYLVPTIEDVSSIEKKIKNICEKVKWDWLIKCDSAIDLEDFTKKISDCPDIIITIPQVVQEYFLLQQKFIIPNLWFVSLSFIIIDDINFYEPEELVHLKNLIKALKLYFISGTTPNFLLIGIPIASPKKFAYEILGQIGTEIIEKEGNAKNSFQIKFWLPSIKTEMEGTDKVKITHSDYFEEILLVLSIFCQEGGKYLVWYAPTSITEEQRKKLREKVAEINATILFCSRLQEIEKEYHGQFDVIFIWGLPFDFARIDSLIGNLIKSGGLCIIISTEEPLVYFLMKNITIFEKIPLPEIFVADFPNISRYYLCQTIAFLPQKRVELNKLMLIWEDAQKLLQPLIDAKIIINDSGVISVNDYKEMTEFLGYFSWGSLEEKEIAYSFFDEHKRCRKLSFSASILPWKIYKGAILFHGVDKFQISSSDIHSLSYAPDNSPVITIPTIRINVKNEKDISKKITPYGEISILDLELEEELIGYVSFSAYTLSEKTEIKFSAPEKYTRKTIGIKIKLTPSCEFEVIIKNFMPLLFWKYSKFVTITSNGDGIYIYSLFKENRKIIEYLFDRWDTLGKIFFEYGYNLLKNCHCLEGCPLCLHIFDYTKETMPNKNNLLISLSKNKEEVENIIKFKKEGLAGEIADKKYNEWKNNILSLFDKNFGMKIKKVAKLVCKEKIEVNGKSVKGFYSKGEVQIAYNLPEHIAVMAIAHEYTHNWEYEPLDEPNLFTKFQDQDNLVAEGFAQWVSLKVLNFYGFIYNMESISLFVDTEDELGFKLLKWLEEKVGFLGVINFVREGEVVDKKGEKYFLDKIIKDSGLKEEIEERTKKIEEGIKELIKKNEEEEKKEIEDSEY